MVVAVPTKNMLAFSLGSEPEGWTLTSAGSRLALEKAFSVGKSRVGA